MCPPRIHALPEAEGGKTRVVFGIAAGTGLR
jgi:hypothetical protein